jgi:hypothetical protein
MHVVIQARNVRLESHVIAGLYVSKWVLSSDWPRRA